MVTDNKGASRLPATKGSVVVTNNKGRVARLLIMRARRSYIIRVYRSYHIIGRITANKGVSRVSEYRGCHTVAKKGVFLNNAKCYLSIVLTKYLCIRIHMQSVH